MSDIEPGAPSGAPVRVPSGARAGASSGASSGAPVDNEANSPGRGRQIVTIFLVIGVITIAFMQFHASVPGLDQLVGVTPIVLALIVIATIWLLYRLVRRR